MKGYSGTKTPESERDQWQTPKYIFEYYHNRFSFTHDVAASEGNTLCDNFFTEYDDGLLSSWGKSNWLNPPYSNTAAWIEKAIKEKSNGNLTVMIVPAATSTAWFSSAVKNCNEYHLITGRIGFVSNITGEEVKNNNIGSVVFIFDPDSPVSSYGVLKHRDDMKRFVK